MAVVGLFSCFTDIEFVPSYSVQVISVHVPYRSTEEGYLHNTCLTFSPHPQCTATL